MTTKGIAGRQRPRAAGRTHGLSRQCPACEHWKDLEDFDDLQGDCRDCVARRARQARARTRPRVFVGDVCPATVRALARLKAITDAERPVRR